MTETVAEGDVLGMAARAGARTPRHPDEGFGRRTRSGGRVARGILTASPISATNTQLAGPGFVYRGQELTFPAPVRMGDAVTAASEVVEVRADRQTLRVRAGVRNQRGELVADGMAGLKRPSEAE